MILAKQSGGKGKKRREGKEEKEGASEAFSFTFSLKCRKRKSNHVEKVRKGKEWKEKMKEEFKKTGEQLLGNRERGRETESIPKGEQREFEGFELRKGGRFGWERESTVRQVTWKERREMTDLR